MADRSGVNHRGEGSAFGGSAPASSCMRRSRFERWLRSPTDKFDPARLGLKTWQVAGAFLLGAITYDGSVVAEGSQHGGSCGWDDPHCDVMELPKATQARKRQCS
jgi:hypothetical protein